MLRVSCFNLLVFPREIYLTFEPVGARKQCCCGHENRCICATKIDSNLGVVPESSPLASRRSAVSGLKRPHLTLAKTDPPGLAYRHNAKHNDSSKRAHPYSIPRSRTIHGSIDATRRSMDQLPLVDTHPGKTLSPLPDSITSAPRPVRRVRSEHGSPVPDLEEVGPQISPIDIPRSAYFDQTAFHVPLVDYPPQSPRILNPPDMDLALEPAMAQGPPIDWSTFDLAYGSEACTPTYSHPASYASFDYHSFGQHGFARSSTGESPDPDDLPPVAAINGVNSEVVDVPSLIHASEPSSGMYPAAASPSPIGPQDSPFPISQGLESLEIDSVLHSGGNPNHATSPRNIPMAPDVSRYSMPQSYTPEPSQNYNSVNANGMMLVQPPYTTSQTHEPIWVPASYPAVYGGVPVASPEANHWHL